MTYSALLSQTVSLVSTTSSAQDDEGNPITSEVLTQSPGLIQQTGTSEARVGPDTLTADYLLFLPAEADVTGFDQVECAGVRYEIVGIPDIVFTPAGAHHQELKLRLVKDGGSSAGS